MKVKIYITIAFFIFMQHLYSQLEKAAVPEIIVESFQEKFPNAKSVEWEKEGGDEWEADFLEADEKYSASFTLAGAWLATELEIEKRDMPSYLSSLLKENLGNFELEEVQLVIERQAISYEIDITQGGEQFEILIDSKGKLRKEKVMDSDDED